MYELVVFAYNAIILALYAGIVTVFAGPVTVIAELEVLTHVRFITTPRLISKAEYDGRVMFVDDTTGVPAITDAESRILYSTSLVDKVEIVAV